MGNYNKKPSFKQGGDENFYKEEAYLRAKKKLDELKGFYWHLAAYIIVNIFLILLIGFNSKEGFFQFGTFATAFFWGIGLAFHALAVFGKDFIFGKNWEKKKIQEFMDKDTKSWM